MQFLPFLLTKGEIRGVLFFVNVSNLNGVSYNCWTNPVTLAIVYISPRKLIWVFYYFIYKTL